MFKVYESWIQLHAHMKVQRDDPEKDCVHGYSQLHHEWCDVLVSTACIIEQEEKKLEKAITPDSRDPATEPSSEMKAMLVQLKQSRKPILEGCAELITGDSARSMAFLEHCRLEARDASQI